VLFNLTTKLSDWQRWRKKIGLSENGFDEGWKKKGNQV